MSVAPPEPHTITATAMQQKSGQILRQVAQHHRHFVVERAGYPVAAIVPLEDYHRYIQSAKGGDHGADPTPLPERETPRG
ncbi:MAG: type II toxin-antitoxin system Phd/YefM family antitoxin [Anaerolineales bacterium]|nr:type II toxin-antitoxin system Phd/YefM family antitoxin [Anaerolineales bacterium]